MAQVSSNPHPRPARRAALWLCKLATYTLYSCLLLACANNEPSKERFTEKQYYESAQKAIAANNYLLAIEQLEQLESRFPFGLYAKRVQLDLIYSHYRSLDYDAAEAQAQRFIRLHPDHPNVDYAYYMKGLSSFSVDRGFLARFLPTRPSERDMTSVKQSFTDFNRLVNKFPDSRYAEDARQRMRYLRNLLAEHEINSAAFYIRRGALLAAANRARYVVEHYPSTPAMADALAIMLTTYREIGIDALAERAELMFMANFPQQTDLIDKHQRHIQQQRDRQRSWLNLLSFGWLG